MAKIKKDISEGVKENEENKNSEESKGPKSPKKIYNGPLHLSKYLQKKDFNKMQIVAVEATINRKAKKTVEEWDILFKKVINKRLR